MSVSSDGTGPAGGSRAGPKVERPLLVVAARDEARRLGAALRRALRAAGLLLRLREHLHPRSLPVVAQAWMAFSSFFFSVRAASQSSHGASGFTPLVSHVLRQFSGDWTRMRRSRCSSSSWVVFMTSSP